MKKLSLSSNVLFSIGLLLLSLSAAFHTHADGQTISITTQNAYNFLNDQKDGKREKVLSAKNYALRLKRLSNHLANNLGSSDIIALQEVENLNTLIDLKAELNDRHNLCYQAILLESQSNISINVGYLIDCQFKIKNLSALFKNKLVEPFNKALFTRPPLYLHICKHENCLHLINVHMRSMLGIKHKKKSYYVKQKRLQQAQHLAQWINRFQNKWPNEKLIVLGDFNALNTSDQYVDVLGIIKGDSTSSNVQFNVKDLVEKNLFDISSMIPFEQRVSYVYRKKPQVLDYILVSKNTVPSIQNARFSDIDYRVSDHAGLVVQLLAE